MNIWEQDLKDDKTGNQTSPSASAVATASDNPWERDLLDDPEGNGHGNSGSWEPESTWDKTKHAAGTVWDYINKPLVEGTTEEQYALQRAKDYAASGPTKEEAKHPTLTGLKKGGAGMYADTVDTLKSFTSPLGLATIAAGPVAEGEGALGKTISAGSRLAGVGFGAKGAKDAVEGTADVIDNGATPENTRQALSGAGQALLGGSALVRDTALGRATPKTAVRAGTRSAQAGLETAFDTAMTPIKPIVKGVRAVTNLDTPVEEIKSWSPKAPQIPGQNYGLPKTTLPTEEGALPKAGNASPFGSALQGTPPEATPVVEKPELSASARPKRAIASETSEVTAKPTLDETKERALRHVLGDYSMDELGKSKEGVAAAQKLSNGSYKNYADLANYEGIQKSKALSAKTGPEWTPEDFQRTTAQHGKELNPSKELVLRHLVDRYNPTEIAQRTEGWGGRASATEQPEAAQELSPLTTRLLKALGVSEQGTAALGKLNLGDAELQRYLVKLNQNDLDRLAEGKLPRRRIRK